MGAGMSDIESKAESASGPKALRLPKALSNAARTPGIGTFDKAFAVLVSGPQGVTNGVGRNISEGGMFIETREPYGLGTPVRITFSADELLTEIEALAEVRFQCFLNYAGASGEQEGLRGMGVRFLSFESADAPAGRRPVSQ